MEETADIYCLALIFVFPSSRLRVDASGGKGQGIWVQGGDQNSGKNKLDQHGEQAPQGARRPYHPLTILPPLSVRVKASHDHSKRHDDDSTTTTDTTTTTLTNSGNAGAIVTGSNTQTNSVSDASGGKGAGIWVQGGDQNSGKNKLSQKASQRPSHSHKRDGGDSSTTTTTDTTTLTNSGNAGAIGTGSNDQTNSVSSADGGSGGGLYVAGGDQNSGKNRASQSSSGCP